VGYLRGGLGDGDSASQANQKSSLNPGGKDWGFASRDASSKSAGVAERNRGGWKRCGSRKLKDIVNVDSSRSFQPEISEYRERPLFTTRNCLRGVSRPFVEP